MDNKRKIEITKEKKILTEENEFLKKNWWKFFFRLRGINAKKFLWWEIVSSIEAFYNNLSLAEKKKWRGIIRVYMEERIKLD